MVDQLTHEAKVPCVRVGQGTAMTDGEIAESEFGFVIDIAAAFRNFDRHLKMLRQGK